MSARIGAAYKRPGRRGASAALGAPANSPCRVSQEAMRMETQFNPQLEMLLDLSREIRIAAVLVEAGKRDEALMTMRNARLVLDSAIAELERQG